MPGTGLAHTLEAGIGLGVFVRLRNNRCVLHSFWLRNDLSVGGPGSVQSQPSFWELKL